MPEVAIYEGEANAFATGAFRNSALVAVSTGLLQSMNKEEVEAVLGHEIAHVANGDMVTLTLIQGVVNTFVVFFARIIGSIVDKAVFRTERGTGPGYFITVIVAQIVLGILASMIVAYFSRRREFRADAGSAQYLGTPSPMVNALRRLGGVPPGRAAAVDERLRHHRQGRRHGALLDPSADRGAHRRAHEPAIAARERREAGRSTRVFAGRSARRFAQQPKVAVAADRLSRARSAGGSDARSRSRIAKKPAAGVSSSACNDAASRAFFAAPRA